MILPATKEMELTDDQFEELMKKYDSAIDQYVKNMLEDYISFYIAEGFKQSSLFENKLDVISNTAVSLIEGSRKSLYDLNEIKKILEEKYRLKIVDDNKLLIEEI